MLTVGKDMFDVERRLSAGVIACPGCGTPLAGWGHGRSRVLRCLGDVRWRLRPRRGRCPDCGVTHVLVPVGILSRRADGAEVVCAAFSLAVLGLGHRRIAGELGRPEATVRGWLRRFASRAGPVVSAFTVLWCALEPAAVLPQASTTPTGDAWAAIAGAAAAAAGRFVSLAVTVPGFASAVTHAGLLAPGFDAVSINTIRLW